MDLDILIPLIAIGGFYGTIIAWKFLSVEALKHRRGDTRHLETELAALRQEMAALKGWANNLILSFDSTLQQHGARLNSVEQRQLGSGAGLAEARPERETLELRSGV